jgi:hypothetical protein
MELTVVITHQFKHNAFIWVSQLLKSKSNKTSLTWGITKLLVLTIGIKIKLILLPLALLVLTFAILEK